MIEIALTKGFVAVVDDEDADSLSGWKWSARTSRWGPYAVRAETEDGKNRYIYMHRVIVGAISGQVVDHINRNTLDNRKENLRICTTTQNAQNAKSHSDSVSPYKGVSPNSKKGKPWVSQICIRGKQTRLGVFNTQEEAARAYDAVAVAEFGEFARPNFSGENQ